MRTAPLAQVSALLLALACSDGNPTSSLPGGPAPFSPIGEPPAPVSYYVTPTGTTGGDGSMAGPWSLAYALAGAGGRVHPGDTVWVRGGRYPGAFASKIVGTEAAPIIVRQFPGERATLDGAGTGKIPLNVTGPWVTFWGLEVTNSGGSRTVSRPNGVYAHAAHLKFINLVVHDNNVGFTFSNESPGSEIYGSIIYDNGWQTTSKGAGHAIYAKNDGATEKLIRDNIMFNQYGYGIHAYTDAGSGQLKNIRVEGNVSFNNGTVATGSTTANNILVGGYEPAERISVLDNMTYFSPGFGGTNVKLGYKTTANVDATLRGGYFVGGSRVLDVGYWNTIQVTGNLLQGTKGLVLLTDNTPAGQEWSGNVHSRNPLSTSWKYGSTSYTFARWVQVTGLGATDQATSAAPAEPRVFVRPNRYEAGRGTVVVYNWTGQASVDADLSSVLDVGDRYEVHNVQDFFGPPVTAGSYAGGSISIPMDGVQPPAVVGTSVTGPKTGPGFDVFVVTRVAP